MTVDSTFDFERRRNQPVRYSRELMGTTLRVMKRVGEIQKKRADRFHAHRMKLARRAEKVQNEVEIKKGFELLVPAVARDKTETTVLHAVKDRKLATAAVAAARRILDDKEEGEGGDVAMGGM